MNLTLNRPLRLTFAVCALAAAVATDPSRAMAEGREYLIQRHDLRIVIDTRWCGCRNGGYYPIRFRIANLGAARNLTARFKPQDTHLSAAFKTIGVDQNATAQFTLSVPVSGTGNYGRLTIESNGVELEGLRWEVSLPDVAWNEPIRPALLMISPGNVDATMFEQAAQSRFSAAATPAYGRSYGGFSEDHQLVPPTLLPESWIDYSGVDLVSIPLDTLTALPTGPKSALLRWVETGGTLLVTQVGGPASDSASLKKALSLETRAAVSPNWQSADARIIETLGRFVIPPEEMIDGGVEVFVPNEGEPEAPQPPRGLAALTEISWDRSGDAFAIREIHQGRVVAFQGNPYPGVPGDWLWLFASLPPDSFNWITRNGFSSRRAHDEFLQFEIPGLRGVPVSAFLVLITLFGIVIGPLNYFLLWRRKQLWMLVVTIPSIALVTSLSLFGYSMIAHGFGVKSRTRSVTWLDQTHRTAVTTARISLFAGVSPSDGLTFSPETTVMPIWSGASGSMEPGGVDWTETQHLDSRWLRSRTRSQFVTQNHRTERGRLIVGKADGGKLPVENGFSWALDQIVVADEDGTLYEGGAIPAGAAVKLTKLDASNSTLPIAEAIARVPLRLPEGAGDLNQYSRYSHRTRWDYMETGEATAFSGSRMEQAVSRIAYGSGENGKLPAKSYVAVMTENPGVEMGLSSVSEKGPLHVLLGRY